MRLWAICCAVQASPRSGIHFDATESTMIWERPCGNRAEVQGCGALPGRQSDRGSAWVTRFCIGICCGSCQPGRKAYRRSRRRALRHHRQLCEHMSDYRHHTLTRIVIVPVPVGGSEPTSASSNRDVPDRRRISGRPRPNRRIKLRRSSVCSMGITPAGPEHPSLHGGRQKTGCVEPRSPARPASPAR